MTIDNSPKIIVTTSGLINNPGSPRAITPPTITKKPIEGRQGFCAVTFQILV